jgi:outer membrane receptor protein involved in Fe transport
MRFLTVEAGAEGALNILNSRSSLWQDETPVPLPAANVRIEEQRGEAFITGNLRLTPTLSTELGMRYETSTLTQSGDSNLVKDISFAKPRVLTTWRMTPDSDLRLLVERTAGQLAFSNFVSSASVVNDTVKAGNKDLEPDRTTRLEVSWEQRFWDRGALTITARRDNVTAVVDHMPIFTENGMYDAIGNIGNGRRDLLQASLTLPMDCLNLDGVTIQASGNLRHTKVEDPSTGQNRPFSGEQPFDGRVSLTHDLPDLGLRWGTTYVLRDEERYFMASEFERTIEPGRLEAFVEYKPEAHWTMKLFGRRLLQTPVIRERTTYDGLRGHGLPSYMENRALNTGMVVGVNIQRSFAY